MSLTTMPKRIVFNTFTADTVQVYGRVKGMIKARNVSLHSGCMVEGIVLHQAITIADGAVIDGKIKRLDKPQSVTGNDMDDEENSSSRSGATGNNTASPRLLEGFKLIAGNTNN